LNEEFARQQPNQLTRLLPSAAPLAEALRVIDSGSLIDGGVIQLNVDSMKQRGLCYWAAK